VSGPTDRGRVLGPGGALPEGDAKRGAVEAMFDRVAPRYDRVNRVMSLGLDAHWRRRTVEELGLPAGSRVLDLACGTGDLCRTLIDRGHRPVGVDLSAGMLAAAPSTTTRLTLVRGDAAVLPVATAAVDGITCGFALRNFVDLASVFAECARILRPGGRLAALEVAVPANPVLRAANAAWFRGAVPLIGRVLGRDGEAYRYLPRSTAYLPPPTRLLEVLTQAGFHDVRRRTMLGGSVQLLTGTRA
jgi:demethylmenaquinone methyltransferase/2-methoxy-6-polyprenyl-1,4-benzoquinol methylase